MQLPRRKIDISIYKEFVTTNIRSVESLLSHAHLGGGGYVHRCRFLEDYLVDGYLTEKFIQKAARRQ